MPANPKYLTKTPHQRFAKISAGLLGGYIISALLHMVIALLSPNHLYILITGVFTMFLVWGTLLVIPFLFKNGWKAWGLYMIIILVLYVIYYYVNSNNPIL